MTNTAATDKQTTYIVTLYNKIHGTRHGYVSQCRKELGLSSFQVQKLSKAQASAIIDQLLAKV